MSRYYIMRSEASKRLQMLEKAYSLKEAEVKLANVAKDLQLQNKGLHVSEVNEHGQVTVREPSSNEYFLGILPQEEVLDKPVQVISSMIKWIGFDTNTNEVVVCFTNGKNYRYADVPEALFFQVLDAESIGQMFNATIKGKFECRPTT